LTSEIRAASMEEEAFAEELTAKPESVQPEGPPTFAGFDAGSYPGQKAMDTYRSSGFSVTGVYLSHAPARSSTNGVDTQWIAAASNLAKLNKDGHWLRYMLEPSLPVVQRFLPRTTRSRTHRRMRPKR
jgi:hypothetical protein